MDVVAGGGEAGVTFVADVDGAAGLPVLLAETASVIFTSLTESKPRRGRLFQGGLFTFSVELPLKRTVLLSLLEDCPCCLLKLAPVVLLEESPGVLFHGPFFSPDLSVDRRSQTDPTGAAFGLAQGSLCLK